VKHPLRLKLSLLWLSETPVIVKPAFVEAAAMITSPPMPVVSVAEHVNGAIAAVHAEESEAEPSTPRLDAWAAGSADIAESTIKSIRSDGISMPVGLALIACTLGLYGPRRIVRNIGGAKAGFRGLNFRFTSKKIRFMGSK